jgi:hypothetical protein
MYVAEFQFENIRGFGQMSESLDLRRPDGSYAGWTVVAGRNASGKTTVLRAIALALAGPVVAHALMRSFEGWMRVGAESGAVRLRLTRSPLDTVQGSGQAASAVSVGLKWTAQGNELEPSLEQDTPPRGQSKVAAQRGPWADNPAGWFAAAYGPFRRPAFSGSPSSLSLDQGGRFAALRGMFDEEATLTSSLFWLRDIYLRRLEGRPGAEELERDVLALLDDGLLPEEAHVVKIDADGLWIAVSGVDLPLRDISDGYRIVTTLVLDIARRLHEAYGDLNLISTDSGVQILHEGVVLIDEVESHLHVSWQQWIGAWMREHFPLIQFIVTTHSPFVCQAADESGLIQLGAPGSGELPRHAPPELYRQVVNGSAEEAVISDLFGLDVPYSPRAAALRRRLADLEALLAREAATPAQISELRELQSTLPSTLSREVAEALDRLAAKLDQA